MICDIIHFMKNKEKLRTMQRLIRMSKLFQGFVVKDQVNTNKTTKYTSFNKVLIRKCTKYYYECWEEQNKLHHDPELQKTLLQIGQIKLG